MNVLDNLSYLDFLKINNLLGFKLFYQKSSPNLLAIKSWFSLNIYFKILKSEKNLVEKKMNNTNITVNYEYVGGIEFLARYWYIYGPYLLINIVLVIFNVIGNFKRKLISKAFK